MKVSKNDIIHRYAHETNTSNLDMIKK